MRDMQGIEVNGCKINIEWSKESGRYHKNTFFRSPPPKGDRNRMERFEKVEKNRKHRKYASRSRSFSNSRSRSRESYVYRRRQRFHTRSRSPTPVNHNRRQHRREANDRRRKRQRSRSQSRSRWRSYSARYSQEKGDFGRDRDRRTFRSKANNYRYSFTLSSALSYCRNSLFSHFCHLPHFVCFCLTCYALWTSLLLLLRICCSTNVKQTHKSCNMFSAMNETNVQCIFDMKSVFLFCLSVFIAMECGSD